MLHGRDEETARLQALLDEARAGQASSLVITGGPGLGKSALLEEVAARAGDALVLRTAGLESESPLAFAALQRLLRPVMGRAPALPASQAQALQVAFGEAEGDRIDPFLVSLATLSMLTDASESRPVLCLLDDAHWLDLASAEALLFAARRLLAEPVVMLFASRDEGSERFEAHDVARMELRGLSGAAAGSLLRERSRRPLSDEVVARLVSATDGNPLGLVELPDLLSSEQLEGAAALPDAAPVSQRVERTFLDRCRRLSGPAQTMMLIAAADDSGRLSVLKEAGAALDLSSDALDELEAAGLVTVDGRGVRVRHPLVRSAVYQSATGAERRNAHAALAVALARAGDVDREIWHRAAASEGPDELVAGSLESVGHRAAQRGGHDSAAAAYARAAQLSVQDEPRARRLFQAGRSTYAAGRITAALALLDDSNLIADDTLLRADIARLRGRIEVVAGSATDGHRIFLRAAANVAELDQERAAEMAALAGIMRSHGVDSGVGLPDNVEVKLRATDSVRHRCFKLLVGCTAADAADERGRAMALLQEALDVGLQADDRDLWANLANMALHLGDDRAHRRYFYAMLSAAREDGAIMEVLYALHRVALSELAGGDWRAARRSADDAISLARSIGHPAMTVPPTAVLMLLAAWEGDAEFETLHTATEQGLAQHHVGIMEPVVRDLLRWAQGTRAAYDGAATEAFHHLAQIRMPAVQRVAVQPRIAAAVHAKELDRAAAWTAETEKLANAINLPWAHAVAHHGQALLTSGEQASGHFEAALAQHALSGRLFDQACTQLAYGEHLRRGGKRVEARSHLSRALETFRDLRAGPLIERATRELRASGETARRRDPSTLVQLTPTELNIAQLVSQGLSNKEVAAQAWISPRTVAFHLRNVFTKTGVTSRGELARLDLG